MLDKTKTPTFGRRINSEAEVAKYTIEESLATQLNQHALTEQEKARELVRLIGLLGEKHTEIVTGLQDKVDRAEDYVESRLTDGEEARVELETLSVENALLQTSLDTSESERGNLTAELSELATAVENVLTPKVSILNDALDSARKTIKKWEPEAFDTE